MFFEKKLETVFRGYHSLTEDVREMITKSEIKEGYCVISLPNQATAICITSFWDKRGLDDLFDEIDRNIPTRVNYKSQVSPFDASGNVKGGLIGRSAMLLIRGGELILGSSQGIVLLEFDGPQERSYQVNIEECQVTFSLHSLKTEFMGMHDVTVSVSEALKRSKIENGLCHISMLHSTAGLLLCTKNEEAKEDVMKDIEHMVPTRADFKHRETASDAGGHVKTAMTNSQLTLIVASGKLVISDEQAVVFAEYDGPRLRQFCLGIICE